MPGKRSTLILVLAFAVAFASAASAQLPEPFDDPVKLELGPFRDPVTPVTGTGLADVTVRVDCHAVVHPTEEARPIVLAASGPAWATLALVPEEIFVPGQCTPGEVLAAEAQLVAAVGVDAPAFEAGDVTVTATVPDAHTSEDAATATTTLTPGYAARLDVRVAESERTVDPGESVTVDVTVGNRANGATQVTLALADAPAGWDVAIPEPASLPAPHADADAATDAFPVTVTAPADAGREVATIQVTVHGASVNAQGTDTTEQAVALFVEVRGEDPTGSSGGITGIPGPSALAVIATGVLAALGCRERVAKW